MNRREFLQLSSAVVAALLASACQPSTDNPDRTVIIIGAGIAGLAAARTLVNGGYDVRVLEGRDRLGGRIHTSRQWEDAPVDLGASWIHGTTRNPITALAAEAGATTAPTSYENSLFYDTTGATLSQDREQRLADLSDQVESAIGDAQRDNLEQSLRKTIEQALELETLSERDRQLVEFILNSTVEHEYAGSADQLSTQWFDQSNTYRGGDVVFPDGYDQLTGYLADGLAVELGQSVTAIHWDADQVTVETESRSYSADHVLITLPLGVLKANTVQFTPSLPAEKQTAIDALQMGVLNKCYLRFPSVFWPETVDWLEYLPRQPGQWVEWLNLLPATGKPILLAFNAADFGREIESWDDQRIIDGAMSTLRTIYGDDIPAPVDYQITRWASDPFSYGSYSFNALGVQQDTRNALAAPVGQQLFFAGEATSEYPSTVHGAYNSGSRAADQIMGL